MNPTVALDIREAQTPRRLLIQRVQKNGEASQEETYILDDKEHEEPLSDKISLWYRAAVNMNTGSPRVFISSIHRSKAKGVGGYNERLTLSCAKGQLVMARQVTGLPGTPASVVVKARQDADSNRLPASDYRIDTD